MTQDKTDNWIRVFQVDEAKKHKNGFTIYKVTSVVFPKGAPEAVTKIVVWKRYSDFKKLRNSLKVHQKNCNISEDLPQLMKGRYFRRFEEDLIEEKVKSALKLLNFIARYPPLFTCVPFLQFFNNSYQVSDTVSDYEIRETNDNGNVTDSSSELCNFTLVEKTHLNGENKKDGTFRDEKIFVEDESGEYLCSSEDGSISEGIETLPEVSFNAKPKDTYSLDSVSLSRSNYDESNLNTSSLGVGNMTQSLTSLTDNFERESVVCYTEKPVKASEMWVCIHSNDVRSKSHFHLPSGLSEDSNLPFKAGDYLVEAGYHITQAQKCEVGGEYESAFGFYKAGMACLLSGMSEDNCKERKLAVQEKIKHYAQRAENVYSLHVSKKRELEKYSETSCSEALKAYKVLSVIDKVLLVLNTEDDKQYIIKVLEKSPCPIDLKKKTVIPYNVPHMVKLVKHFENENSIFLVLEYASGGKLWDYVKSCSNNCKTSVEIKNEPDVAESELVKINEGKIEDKNGNASNVDMLKDRTTYTAKETFECNENEEKVIDLSETYSLLTVEEVKQETEEYMNENLDVTDLVKNSQKLLESIKNTLEESDYVTYSLTKDLNDIETALVLEGKFDEDVLEYEKCSESVMCSRNDNTLNSEDLEENKTCTVSDRNGQFSKLPTVLEAGPILSETTIKEWAAQMLVALETLHRWGVICRDLHPENVLLDENKNLLLTFQFHWRGVDVSLSEEAVTGLYAAPETTKIFPVTAVADWWSFGALLFQLLTGKPLSSCYPGGIFSHTSITFPEFLSPEACSLLTELLRYDPTERLGGGVNGPDDIKCHPFFNSIDWQLVYEN